MAVRDARRHDEGDLPLDLDLRYDLCVNLLFRRPDADDQRIARLLLDAVQILAPPTLPRKHHHRADASEVRRWQTQPVVP